MDKVQLINLEFKGRPVSPDEGPEDPFPHLIIVDWKKRFDYFPSLKEIDKMGIELTDTEFDLLASWCLLETHDKLGGWPAWIQSPVHFYCQLCRKEMQFMYQFEPHVNLNYSFGEEFYDREVAVGCGWVFQCPDHKNQLGFTWQSH